MIASRDRIQANMTGARNEFHCRRFNPRRFLPEHVSRTFESETLLYTRVLLTCGQLCTLLRAVLRAPARISLLRSGFDEARVNEPFEVPYARAGKGREREGEKLN